VAFKLSGKPLARVLGSDTSLTASQSAASLQDRANVIGEIRAEAYNVLNHANFGPATLSIASGTFGKILTSGNPRILEFALKYIF
jgi:hypothetical protein